jgi:hypothetical protein
LLPTIYGNGTLFFFVVANLGVAAFFWSTPNDREFTGVHTFEPVTPWLTE